MSPDRLRTRSRLVTIKGAESGWWGSVWCLETFDWLAKVEPEKRCSTLGELVDELLMQIEEYRAREAA